MRQNRDGGGLAIGCIKELNPVLVRKGDDDTEALSINIFLKNMKIRCVAAYGVQENCKVENKNTFWAYIEEEVTAAWDSDSGFILHFDGNLWAGPNLVPGDPRPQNQNGKLFMDFLSRHPNLTVVNSLPICEGLITRSRIKEGIPERSVLDFFVVCSRVLPFVTKMVIDEDKKYILTNYKNSKNRKAGFSLKRKRNVTQNKKQAYKATDSDHFTQYMDIKLELKTEKPVRTEIFNFKDNDSQVKFKEITTKTDEFTKCFEDDLPLIKQVENWRHLLKSHCYKAFKKIRINKKKPLKPPKPEIKHLIDVRNKLSNNNDDPEIQ